MHRAQRAGHVGGGNHRGNVALRSALGNGAHVDPRLAKGPEEARRDTWSARHAVPDHRQNPASAGDPDFLDLRLGQFQGEGVLHNRLDQVGGFFRNRKTDGMLRTALGDEHHRDSRITQRAKEAIGGTGHADHAGALQVDQGDTVNAADPLDHRRRPARRRDDPAPRVLRVERAANTNRNLVGYRRRHGLGMNHPGSEIGQFHGFVVGNLVDDRRLRHAPRVTAHHAIHVRPDVNGVGRKQGRKN